MREFDLSDLERCIIEELEKINYGVFFSEKSIFELIQNNPVSSVFSKEIIQETIKNIFTKLLTYNLIIKLFLTSQEDYVYIKNIAFDSSKNHPTRFRRKIKKKRNK